MFYIQIASTLEIPVSLSLSFIATQYRQVNNKTLLHCWQHIRHLWNFKPEEKWKTHRLPRSFHRGLKKHNLGTLLHEFPELHVESLPIGSMYGIFTYIYHKNQPNVGKYTIHGSYGLLPDMKGRQWLLTHREIFINIINGQASTRTRLIWPS